MALFPLQIPPGIDTEHSPLDASPAWVDCDKVRFRAGRPESWRGWRKAYSTPLTGIARAAQAWQALDLHNYIAFAGSKKLELFSGGTKYDITPLRTSGTLGNNPFTTTNGSALVTVNHAAHGEVVNDIVVFAGATTFNGVTMNGEYTIVSVTDASNYVVTATTTANASSTGGGASVTYSYLIHGGPDFSYPGLGWGSSRYGSSTYGTPRTTTTTTIGLQTWTMDNWGEDLMANPRGDYIYLWQRSLGTTTRAAKISAAPKCNFVMVSPTDRTLIAFGSDAGSGTIDPMLISWSNQEDYNTWTAAPNNSAGTFRLTEGSRIVAAIRTRNIILVFTDRALYGMQFTGAPFTFSFSLLATGCGVIGPHALVEHGGNVFWLGGSTLNFFVYNGGVNILPSTLLNYVQNNIDTSQNDQVYAYLNKLEHEVTWLWASNAGAKQIDRYTTFNYLDNTWYHGSITRSVWVPSGVAGLDSPLAVDFSGQTFFHDLGNDADQAPLYCWVHSSAMELGQGDHFMFVDRLIPDYETLTGAVNVTFYTYRYPNDTPDLRGAFTLSGPTDRLFLRARGRQFELQVASNDTATFWRLGKFRVDARPDGRR